MVARGFGCCCWIARRCPSMTGKKTCAYTVSAAGSVRPRRHRAGGRRAREAGGGGEVRGREGRGPHMVRGRRVVCPCTGVSLYRLELECGRSGERSAESERDTRRDATKGGAAATVRRRPLCRPLCRSEMSSIRVLSAQDVDAVTCALPAPALVRRDPLRRHHAFPSRPPPPPPHMLPRSR